MRRLAFIAPFRIGLVLMLATPRPTAPEAARIQARRSQLRAILARFVVLGLLLASLTRLLWPQHFLSLPRQHFGFWLLIMLLYPLLSVWPQEVIYRRFLRRRYAPLFSDGTGFIIASALAFGFAHILFLNWVAVVLTLAGGALFARSYAGHNSLGLVCFEHALYGCLIFTIGLGNFFFTGAAWHP